MLPVRQPLPFEDNVVAFGTPATIFARSRGIRARRTMRTIQMLLPLVGVSISAGALLLTNPASSLAAQDNPPCPFTNPSVVSPRLGTPVHGYAASVTPPGFNACGLGAVTICRTSG